MEGWRTVFPRVGCCEIERFDVPAGVESHEILLRIRRTLVSPGTELTIFTGRHSHMGHAGSEWLTFPFYPGYSASGEVLAVGSGVSDLKPGDAVFASVAHASHARVMQSKVVKIPAVLSWEQACFAELGTIALHGVRVGGVTLGERVAVFGQGVVGLLALRFARLAGATGLCAIDLDPSRLEAARRWGADTTLVSTNGVNPASIIRERFGGHLADVVIEATGNPAVIASGDLPKGLLGVVVDWDSL